MGRGRSHNVGGDGGRGVVNRHHQLLIGDDCGGF